MVLGELLVWWVLGPIQFAYLLIIEAIGVHVADMLLTLPIFQTLCLGGSAEQKKTILFTVS